MMTYEELKASRNYHKHHTAARREYVSRKADVDAIADSASTYIIETVADGSPETEYNLKLWDYIAGNGEIPECLKGEVYRIAWEELKKWI